MTTIHMDTDLVYDEGRKITYRAIDFISATDRIRYSAGALRNGWSSPRATSFNRDLDNLIEKLRSQCMILDGLGKSVMREVDEWINADRTESAYLSSLKNTFSLSIGDLKKVGAAVILANTLRWSALRPNSIIFTGPNWMRDAVGIKGMTRVIKPTNLAKGMAVVGLIESAWTAASVIKEDLTDLRYEDVSRTVSAATVDGSVRFALSAIGTVGIPLTLGAIVAAVGLPVIAGGAVVLAGTVLLGFAYSKLAEAPLWDLWKQSTMRNDAIETGARVFNQVTNFLQAQTQRVTERVSGAFNNFIRGITASPSPVAP